MLDSTMLSGYVDTSAQWNPGTGNERLPDYRFGGSGKADGFNLDVVQIRIEKPIDSAQWAAGYRIDLWAGPDANALGTQSFGPGAEGGIAADFAIRQAYISLRVPIGNGLDWKIGVFDTIIGYESVESPANPNYTRSFGHTIEPQTHTGILASYRFCESFAVSDYAGSDYSRCSIVSVTENVPPVQVWDELVKSATANEQKSFLRNDHVYIAATEWISSRVLKVKVWGHGEVNPAGFTRFYRYEIGLGIRRQQ